MLVEKADELWDVYTKDREKTGRTHRRGDPMPEGEYHVTVHVCIFNKKNQLLIQQRQPFKKGWPNMWDLSAAGSALAGDSSSRAAEREVFEELGLQLDLSGARPFFTMNFSKGFDDFYLVECDVDLAELHLQEEEVKQVRWAGKEDVLRMQAQGLMIPYWFLGRLFEIRAEGSYDAEGERISNIQAGPASMEHLESCMSLLEIAGWNGAGLTAEELEKCRNTVMEGIRQGRAACAVDGHMAVGVLLFPPERQKPCLMAVHPEYPRQKIEAQMLQCAKSFVEI